MNPDTTTAPILSAEHDYEKAILELMPNCPFLVEKERFIYGGKPGLCPPISQDEFMLIMADLRTAHALTVTEREEHRLRVEELEQAAAKVIDDLDRRLCDQSQLFLKTLAKKKERAAQFERERDELRERNERLTDVAESAQRELLFMLTAYPDRRGGAYEKALVRLCDELGEPYPKWMQKQEVPDVTA